MLGRLDGTNWGHMMDNFCKQFEPALKAGPIMANGEVLAELQESAVS